MPKKLHLTIPEPCHEAWDEMTPINKGRFCISCQKAVIDFTGMSDAQLVAFFKKPSTGSLCGRFAHDQLERDIDIPRKRIPWLKYFFQIALPAFLFSQKTDAQGEIKLKMQEPILCEPGKNVPIRLGNALPTTSLQSKIVNLMGRVVDESGNGVPYASIIVKGTMNGTTTDSVGYFLFKSGTKEKHLTLISSSVGFESAEVFVNTSYNQVPEIILKQAVILSGEVVIAGMVSRTFKGKVGGLVYSIKTTRLNSDEKRIEPLTDLLKIYPNPVQRSQAVKVELKTNKNEPVNVQLFSIDGKLAAEKELQVFEGYNNFQFEIPQNISAGIYIMQILSAKRKVLCKGKIDVF